MQQQNKQTKPTRTTLTTNKQKPIVLVINW